ncbi:MAG: hypothetical protein ACLU6Y_17500 [Ruminococcus sp.]
MGKKRWKKICQGLWNWMEGETAGADRKDWGTAGEEYGLTSGCDYRS